ncbi:SurA N-terminal domain-containing protein [Desulforhopalus sp. IMCC35007]|uniref:SurA N-terminal domain-containing protein n=1 Tax=Desulforhopalus sp. IMCC35007 TaxID=2569543 RepID=UPI00145C47A1|nr:SurA N-terminal domain-containing protein [Desulforhopalus sp. IMCC35007]
MLQILRRKAQSTFIQIIVVIIALVFIFWGVGSNLSGDRQAAVVVNGDEVSFQDYQQAYDRTYERFSQQFGGNMPKDLAESLGIKQQVINQLIQTSLLRQGAQKMGIYVSAEEVRKVIEGMVQFQDNGAFSMDRYKAVLTNIRTAPTKFEKSMRTDRLAEVAVREISNFASVATESEIQEIYSQLNEKVVVNFVSFKPSDYLNQVQTDDAGLSAWYETVKDNYKTSPEIQLKYFTFTYDKIADKVVIDDSQIENYYQENTQLYTVPEQRKASHILFKTTADDSQQVFQEKEAKAEKVLALAKNGSNFADLAKEYSEGPSRENGGELGYFSRGQMVPAFDDAVFSMEKGAVSEVVQTQFGYHIIYLEDIKPASTRSLEEVKAQIVTTLKEKEAESLAFQVANSAYENIIAAGGLDQYLSATPDAELQTTELFKREAAPDDLKKDSIFLDKAFSLNKGDFSSLIKGNSGYAIFYVENVKEPETPALIDIKELLTNDFKTAESKKLAQQAADDLLKQLHDGGSLEEMAAAKGYAVTNSGELSRDGQNDKTTFPQQLLSEAFLLSGNSPLPQEVGQDGDNYYVYSFLSRTLPKMPEGSTEIEQYRTSLLNFKQQQLLSAWLQNQQVKAKISTHPSL